MENKRDSASLTDLKEPEAECCELCGHTPDSLEQENQRLREACTSAIDQLQDNLSLVAIITLEQALQEKE